MSQPSCTKRSAWYGGQMAAKPERDESEAGRSLFSAGKLAIGYKPYQHIKKICRLSSSCWRAGDSRCRSARNGQPTVMCMCTRSWKCRDCDHEPTTPLDSRPGSHNLAGVVGIGGRRLGEFGSCGPEHDVSGRSRLVQSRRFAEVAVR